MYTGRQAHTWARDLRAHRAPRNDEDRAAAGLPGLPGGFKAQ